MIHGVPRATFNLDMLIEPELENATRLLKAFAESGMGTACLIAPEDLLKNEITIFNDIVRIDVQTKTPGIEFHEVFGRKNIRHYEDVDFWILNVEDLIASKLASNREVDISDVEILKKR